MMKRKAIIVNNAVAITITLFFLLIAILRFPYAFTRLIESGKDFCLSIAYYFDELFFNGNSEIVPTVNELSQVALPSMLGISDNFEEFKLMWQTYWVKFIDKRVVVLYLQNVAHVLYDFSKILIIILPLVILLIILRNVYYERQNNDYNVDSKAVKCLRWVEKWVYKPVKRRITEFVRFVGEHRLYVFLWVLIWSYAFNFITIILEAISYYFYLAVSFDIINFYRQVFKLTVDLSAVVGFVPILGWLIIAYIIVCTVRKKIALKRLNHFERRNRGFINERPIVYMVCGTMGTKKTTTITDMALSQEIMLRDKAFEKILENDLKFPYFPWINLENDIKRCMEFHQIYNLATCRNYVARKKSRWQKHRDVKGIFDYDYVKYGTTYDDKLKIVDIWEVIENYTQLYFIYVIESSLIISNYAIRTENVLTGNGNFPIWNSNFFVNDSEFAEAYTRHSHILDFDSLRLGRKIVEDNAFADSFEFGVVVITEIGKERGNNLELMEKKKRDDEPNQKNDLFNYWLKMVRHSATVDNYPFVKVITDEQRPASWGADARDLCDIVTIIESSEQKLAMPFFFVAELAYSLLFSKFEDRYYTYRYNRADNTLLMYLYKAFFAAFHRFYTKIYNLYGYSVSKLKVEAGTFDGRKKIGKYYLMNKKIYSKRFSTDCFSDFFMKKSFRSRYGIKDLEEYTSEKATFDELFLQNSYFIRDLYNGLFNKSDNNDCG